jgi:23S rRNA G2445 N2-methylase RlmL
VHTLPGLERIAWNEIREFMPMASRIRRGRGLILFQGPPNGEGAAELLNLRSTEDLFALIHQRTDLSRGRDGLKQIQAAITQGDALETALAVHRRCQPHRVRRITYRVVAQKTGRHAFRRVDAQEAVRRAILARTERWKPVDKDAHLEIWVDIRGDALALMIRLSDHTMRQRTYKEAHIPASLRPTVAAAMVRLSEPTFGEVFVDAMCGAGTILLERMDVGAAMIVGGDNDAEAMEAAIANTPYRGVSVVYWDARALPLPDGGVDKVVTNLPWGVQLGSSAQNRTLYPAFFQELVRVLRSGGRAVLLTSEEALMEELLDAEPALYLLRLVPLTILGQAAAMYLLERSYQPV